jgi:hypothetical protein
MINLKIITIAAAAAVGQPAFAITPEQAKELIVPVLTRHIDYSNKVVKFCELAYAQNTVYALDKCIEEQKKVQESFIRFKLLEAEVKSHIDK